MQAKITVNAKEVLGKLNPLIFGTMLENWGEPGRHTIYGSVWVGEESPTPNLRGLREDVLMATKEMSPTIIRWPGGCPSDVYHWLNGVGPREKRPRSLLSTYWSRDVDETNQFGTHEFLDFCREVGADPYINVNVGTGTPEEAANWVEYCNREGRTQYSVMRAENGHPRPFNVKYWGIGNELYSWFEVGYMDAQDHACTVTQYSKVMRMVDPTVEIIAVGCERDDWNTQLLQEAGSSIDYISIHKYYMYEDYYTLVACPLEAEKSLRRLANQINSVLASRKKGVNIAVDEWNVWHKEANPPNSTVLAGFQKLTLQDGLFTAGMFHVMANPSNRVGMGNICNLTNSGPCGPIATTEETMYVNPQYLAFKLYRKHIGNVVVHSETDSDTYDAGEIGMCPESLVSMMPEEMKELFEKYLEGFTDKKKRRIDNVPYLDCLATLDSKEGRLYLAIINRHEKQDQECTVNIKGLMPKRQGRMYELNAEEPTSANDFEHPNDVKITEKKLSSGGTRFDYLLPRHSVTIIEIIV